jgi:cytosine/adenosine deaminase-related metal-dependent hydrolase
MHVAEQPAEVEACVAETKRRPVELLAELGVLSEQFVAVHGTHLSSSEVDLLGKAGSFVCLCPTTERDLADGLPDLGALLEQEVRICFGVDGYSLCDPFEEMRGAILGERLRTGRRFGRWPAPAERLWRASSDDGARALGFDDAGGHIETKKGALAMELVTDDHWLDALVFSGSASLVDRVVRTC